MTSFYGWHIDYGNPRILDTWEKVDEMNPHEERIGSKIRWDLGDHCYWVNEHKVH